MIDINKLDKMLDEAWASESVESLNIWMEGQIKADREAGMVRNSECEILHPIEMGTATASQEAIIGDCLTEYVPYYMSTSISDEFEINSVNDYNLAS